MWKNGRLSCTFVKTTISSSVICSLHCVITAACSEKSEAWRRYKASLIPLIMPHAPLFHSILSTKNMKFQCLTCLCIKTRLFKRRIKMKTSLHSCKLSAHSHNRNPNINIFVADCCWLSNADDSRWVRFLSNLTESDSIKLWITKIASNSRGIYIELNERRTLSAAVRKQVEEVNVAKIFGRPKRKAFLNNHLTDKDKEIEEKGYFHVDDATIATAQNVHKLLFISFEMWLLKTLSFKSSKSGATISNGLRTLLNPLSINCFEREKRFQFPSNI